MPLPRSPRWTARRPRSSPASGNGNAPVLPFPGLFGRLPAALGGDRPGADLALWRCAGAQPPAGDRDHGAARLQRPLLFLAEGPDRARPQGRPQDPRRGLEPGTVGRRDRHPRRRRHRPRPSQDRQPRRQRPRLRLDRRQGYRPPFPAAGRGDARTPRMGKLLRHHGRAPAGEPGAGRGARRGLAGLRAPARAQAAGSPPDREDWRRARSATSITPSSASTSTRKSWTSRSSPPPSATAARPRSSARSPSAKAVMISSRPASPSCASVSRPRRW